MCNDPHDRADMDYAAYLLRVRTESLDDALDEIAPRATDASRARPGCASEPVESTDYFVFYQQDSRWAWRRVSSHETIVDNSNGSFRFYLQCVADARSHGWDGKPSSLFAMSGFSRCGSPDSH